MTLFLKKIDFSLEQPIFQKEETLQEYKEKIKQILEKKYKEKEIQPNLIFSRIISLELEPTRQLDYEGFTFTQKGTLSCILIEFSVSQKEICLFNLGPFDGTNLFQTNSFFFRDKLIPLKNLSKNELKPISEQVAGIKDKEEYTEGKPLFLKVTKTKMASGSFKFFLFRHYA